MEMQQSQAIYQRHQDPQGTEQNSQSPPESGSGLYKIHPRGVWLAWSIPSWDRLQPRSLSGESAAPIKADD